MTLPDWIVAYLAYAYLFWLLFVAVITMKAKWKSLPLVTKVIAAPAGIAGVVLDVLFNVLSSVVFVELPREWMFTSRVSRHKPEQTWRGTLSRFICHNLLDPFEVGGHCH